MCGSSLSHSASTPDARNFQVSKAGAENHGHQEVLLLSQVQHFHYPECHNKACYFCLTSLSLDNKNIYTCSFILHKYCENRDAECPVWGLLVFRKSFFSSRKRKIKVGTISNRKSSSRQGLELLWVLLLDQTSWKLTSNSDYVIRVIFPSTYPIIRLVLSLQIRLPSNQCLIHQYLSDQFLSSNILMKWDPQSYILQTFFCA